MRAEDRAKLTSRARERRAYWAGVIDGYGAAEDRDAMLEGGPYGPAFGYPPSRYVPQPSYGVDYTYAPWAGRGP